MKVIYHCDDYGMTPSVTRRIADAWESGLLDGFSILANGNACEEGARRLKDNANREVRIAVHLNLFEGAALGPPEDTSLIADGRGVLNCSFSGLLIRWWFSSVARRAELVSQVEREWRRQIVFVRKLCAPRSVAALDGHLHMHMLPFLFPIAVALAQEFKIGEIRVVREPVYLPLGLSDSLRAGFLVNLVKNRVLNLCVSSARKCLHGSGIRTTDAFVGVLFSGRMNKTTAAEGIEACRRTGAQSIEILFHIGRASEQEARIWEESGGAPEFACSPMRDREYDALRELRG